MLYLNLWITVNDPSDVERVRSLLSEAGRLSRSEPGCVCWEAYQSQVDATRFLIHEQWASQADLDRHRTAPAIATIYVPQILPLVTRAVHPSTLVE